jgi:ABC-type transport system involved in multi-copper enzyme maturation permease subunit
MNRNILRALFRDALYQVLDNLVFRILAVLIVVLVLPLFVVGFRESEIVLAFYWRVPYPEWIRPFIATISADTQSGTIGFLQSAFVDTIAGGLGMLFCIVATSFFVPRMLEKGFADTVLSKPVSRGALLLSRYVAGILFVGLLAVVLVGGQFLGFAAVSGYVDPGFLFSIFTLIWLFMMLHAVSVLCGVMTRSSIAAVMMVIVFYGSVGGIHLGWRIKEAWLQDQRRELASEPKNGDEPAKGDVGTAGTLLMLAADSLHYVLPKTSDAELIAKLFRRRYEMASREVDDDETGVSVSRPPDGYVREPRSSLRAPDGGLLWIARHPGGRGESRWSLEREPLADIKSRSALARDLKKELEARSEVSDIETDRDRFGASVYDMVAWREPADTQTRQRKRWYFSTDEWLLTLDYDVDAELAATEAEQRSARQFLSGIVAGDVAAAQMQMTDPHTRQFGWGGTWKHSAWFSILTTAAFIVATLALATWRMRRIDF